MLTKDLAGLTVPGAVSVAPRTTAQITLFPKNPEASIPRSKAESLPVGPAGEEERFGSRARARQRHSHFLIPEVTFRESLTLSCDTDNVIIGI